MAGLTAFYADRLRRAGYRVIEPMDEDDWRRRLVSELQQFGYRVFAPQRSPRAGSTWAPTRGDSEVRRVVAVTDREVTYEHIPTRGNHPVTLAAWHVWRQRARARGV